MSKPSILILTGYGLNCESESRYAWEQAGAAPTLLHLNDLLERPDRLRDFAGLMFIGGFSFGDHLGSGLVFANKLRTRLRDDLQRFIDAGKLILGVCNGFQIMTKLGLLPGLDRDYFTPTVTLTQNDCGHFINRWVTLRIEPHAPCIFTRGVDRLPVPIRHGEGKLFTTDHAWLARIEAEHCVAGRYEGENPNGSLNAIAGLCDPSGRIFGLMPHPEAYLFPENHPQWDFRRARGEPIDPGAGRRIFENAVSYLRQA